MKTILDSLIKNTIKTSAILKKSSVETIGWDATIHDDKTSIGPVIYAYVWDYPTKWMMLLSLNRDVFVQAAEKASQAPQERILEIRQTLGALISKVSDHGFASESEKEHLAILMAAYAGTTKAWKLVEGPNPGSHFVTLNYRKMNAKNQSYLRPFAANAYENMQPFDSEFIQATIESVAEKDLLKHPEWFSQ